MDGWRYTSSSHSSLAFLNKSFGWLRLASSCSVDARIFKMVTRRIFASHLRTKRWISCVAKCSAAFFISRGFHFRVDAVVRICVIRRSERSLPQNLRARAARQYFCTRRTACPYTCGSGGGHGTSTSPGRKSGSGSGSAKGPSTDSSPPPPPPPLPTSSFLGRRRPLLLPRVDGKASSGISKMEGLRPFFNTGREEKGEKGEREASTA